MNRTRVVRWLRVLLPLAALSILSTLFLLGRESDTDPAIPYAQVDAEDMARQPRMTAPEYAGVTADGAEVTLQAVEAAPDQGRAQSLRLTWRAPDGLAADLTAPEGTLAGQAVSLTGGVRMTLSSGWALSAPQIEAATDRSRIEAPAGVVAFAPFGELRAGAMQLTSGEEKDSHVLDFTGGVRLLYQP